MAFGSFNKGTVAERSACNALADGYFYLQVAELDEHHWLSSDGMPGKEKCHVSVPMDF
jgi:hypothetical protein